MSDAQSAAAAVSATDANFGGERAKWPSASSCAASEPSEASVSIRNRDSVIILDAQASSLLLCRPHPNPIIDPARHFHLPLATSSTFNACSSQGTYHMHQIGSNCPLNLCRPFSSSSSLRLLTRSGTACESKTPLSSASAGDADSKLSRAKVQL